MKILKRLSCAVALTLVFKLSALAGVTQAPPCAPPDPGITQAPPCDSGQIISNDPDAVEGTSALSASSTANDYFATSGAIDFVQQLLSIF
jgi:hypothetical protein